MDHALDYALSVAPADVCSTIEWLLEDGYEVASQRGGRNESFGNVLLGLVKLPIHVRLVRDRSQWMCEMGQEGDQLRGLLVLLTASEDRPVVTPERRDLGKALPEQLPEGVRWKVVVPKIAAWLRDGDRSRQVDRAADEWAAAMEDYFD